MKPRPARKASAVRRIGRCLEEDWGGVKASRHCEERSNKPTQPASAAALDCFAALAMTRTASTSAEQMVDELRQGAEARHAHRALLPRARRGHQRPLEAQFGAFLEPAPGMGDGAQLARQSDLAESDDLGRDRALGGR